VRQNKPLPPPPPFQVICKHSLRGRTLSPHIRILAALNPYRKRPANQATQGLVYRFQGAADNAQLPEDPMSSLIYRYVGLAG
jgi:hypothetical protein